RAGDACAGRANGIVREVCVTLCRACLGMSKQGANQRQAKAQRDAMTGKGVPKVVQAHAPQPGCRGGTLPDPADTVEGLVRTAVARQDPVAFVATRHGGENRECWCEEMNRLSSRFRVRKPGDRARLINVRPLECKDLRAAAASEDQQTDRG